jgi:hypothetical protein
MREDTVDIARGRVSVFRIGHRDVMRDARGRQSGSALASQLGGRRARLDRMASLASIAPARGARRIVWRPGAWPTRTR